MFKMFGKSRYDIVVTRRYLDETSRVLEDLGLIKSIDMKHSVINSGWTNQYAASWIRLNTTAGMMDRIGRELNKKSVVYSIAYR